MRPAFLGLLLAAFAWADALVIQQVMVIGGGAQFVQRGWSADLDPNTRSLTADDWAVQDKLVRESIRLAGRMHRAGSGFWQARMR